MFGHKKCLLPNITDGLLLFIILLTYVDLFIHNFYFFYIIFVSINLFVTFDLLLPRGTRVGVSQFMSVF